MPQVPAPDLLSFHVPAPLAQAERATRLLRALEAQLPGADLSWRAEVSGSFEATDDPRWTERVRLVREPERDRWLAERLARGEDVLLFGGDGCPGLSVSVQPALEVRVQSGEAVGTIAVQLAPGTVSPEALPELVVAGGDALGAWCCAVTPLATMGTLLQVQRGPVGRPNRGREALLARMPALAGLPRLRGGTSALPTVEAPPSIGWLNYWSEAAARWLGFPDEARDGEWLARSIRTPAGAWLLRLTEEPLDVERPAHLDALLRAYQRFDRVGVRG